MLEGLECINDLPESVKSDIFMFSDDTKVSRTIVSDEDRNELQEDIFN